MPFISRHIHVNVILWGCIVRKITPIPWHHVAVHLYVALSNGQSGWGLVGYLSWHHRYEGMWRYQMVKVAGF